MPDLIGLFFDADAMQFAPAGGVEKAKFDGISVFGKNREVHTFAIPRCTEGKGPTWPHDRLSLDDHSSLTGLYGRSGSSFT